MPSEENIFKEWVFERQIQPVLPDISHQPNLKAEVLHIEPVEKEYSELEEQIMRDHIDNMVPTVNTIRKVKKKPTSIIELAKQPIEAPMIYRKALNTNQVGLTKNILKRWSSSIFQKIGKKQQQPFK